MKVWILQNQMRTEKQMRAAALRHRIFFFSLTNNTIWKFNKLQDAVLSQKEIRNQTFSFSLITCMIARSNPRRLFPFYASSNGTHVTMTSQNDPRTWCHEHKVRFLLKRQTSARTTPRTRSFITVMLWSSHLDWSKFCHRDR